MCVRTCVRTCARAHVRACVRGQRIVARAARVTTEQRWQPHSPPQPRSRPRDTLHHSATSEQHQRISVRDQSRRAKPGQARLGSGRRTNCGGVRVQCGAEGRTTDALRMRGVLPPERAEPVRSCARTIERSAAHRRADNHAIPRHAQHATHAAQRAESSYVPRTEPVLALWFRSMRRRCVR